MNNCNNEPGLKANSDDLLSCNKSWQGKLYVAYRNNTLIDENTSFIENDNSQGIIYNNGRASVFSTTGGFYYIDGIPAMLSQDDEAMLYDRELAEYY